MFNGRIEYLYKRGNFNKKQYENKINLSKNICARKVAGRGPYTHTECENIDIIGFFLRYTNFIDFIDRMRSFDEIINGDIICQKLKKYKTKVYNSHNDPNIARKMFRSNCKIIGDKYQYIASKSALWKFRRECYERFRIYDD